MITSFRAQKFGCLDDVEVKLTPLHAFVGPNDSGKSTLLRAVRTVCQLASGGFSAAASPFEPWMSERADLEPWLKVSTPSGGELHWLGFEKPPFDVFELTRAPGAAFKPLPRTWQAASGRSAQERAVLAPIQAEIGRALLVRLDPDHLRAQSDLNAANALADRSEWRGDGLPTMVNTLLARGDDSFARVRGKIQELFPHIQRIGAPGLSSSHVGLEVELTSGEVLNADQLSEGLLYYLAFLVLNELNPFDVLLIEEPENGLHPSRIADVVKVLRALTEAESPTQVLIATHSPLLINELEPDEVSVVVRPADHGTRVVPMKQTKNFEERSGVYALGELWLSYADGEIEAELVGE